MIQSTSLTERSNMAVFEFWNCFRLDLTRFTLILGKKSFRVIPSFFGRSPLDRNEGFFLSISGENTSKHLLSLDELYVVNFEVQLFSVIFFMFKVFDENSHFHQFWAYFWVSHFFPCNVSLCRFRTKMLQDTSEAVNYLMWLILRFQTFFDLIWLVSH